MANVGVHEARTRFSRLLDRVARGERITITRRGAPVADLVPAARPRKQSVGEAIRSLRALRQGNRLDGLPIQELIEEGRR